MSVDYSANAGLGYEVEPDERFADSPDYEFTDWLDTSLSEGFSYFETGNAFSGYTDGIYIVVDDPFSKSDGLDLSDVKLQLDVELKRLELEPVGDFDVVGGLYIF